MTIFLTLLSNTESTRNCKPGITLLCDVTLIKRKNQSQNYFQTTYLQGEKKEERRKKIDTKMESLIHFSIFLNENAPGRPQSSSSA